MSNDCFCEELTMELFKANTKIRQQCLEIAKKDIALWKLVSDVFQMHDELKKAEKEIRELKSKNRYKNFIDIATENLRLAEENAKLKRAAAENVNITSDMNRWW